MTQVLSVSNTNEKNLNAAVDLGYQEKQEIIDTLVEQGLPRAFNPSNFIKRIADTYGISTQDAKDCLREAVTTLETTQKKEKEQNNEEKLYAQSGYFYPSSNSVNTSQRDGMDSLSAYGAFQRLKFGLY